MSKSIFHSFKHLALIIGIVAIGLSLLIASCVPGAVSPLTPATGASMYPYIQSITAEVIPSSGTSTATATATGAATGTATATPTSTATATGTATATATATGTATATATATPTSTATATPTATAAAGGSDIAVSINVENFDISSSSSATTGAGTVNYYLDEIPPIGTSVPATTQNVVTVADNTYIWPNVQPGLHVVSAELVNSDMTPLSTPVVASAMVWVPGTDKASSPMFSLISVEILPASSATSAATETATGTATETAVLTGTATETGTAGLTETATSTATETSTATSAATKTATSTATATSTGTATATKTATSAATATATATAASAGAVDIMISVNNENFDVVSKEGQTPVTGQGHIHYFLDAIPPTFPYQTSVTGIGTYVHTEDTSYTWTNVQPGVHLLTAELVNNDHTALNPPVVAAVLITVMPAGSPPSGTATSAATETSTATGTTTSTATSTATGTATSTATGTSTSTNY